MKKIFLFICLALFLITPIVFADGMVIDRMGFIPESQQLAAINYQNGLEKMILTIQTDELRTEKSAWIFPVKGDPNSVVVDVVTQFPMLNGYEVTSRAKSVIGDFISGLRYPFFYPLLNIFRKIGRVTELSASSAESIRVSTGDVTVYEHIEKNGVTTELIGAETGLDIYLYLGNKDLDLKLNIAGVINQYIDKGGYVFVVSWVSNETEVQSEKINQYEGYYPYRGRRLGVLVMFPTDKIYYPLLPTSVYGSAEVPATIYVLDYVTPNLYENIKSFVKTNYYTSYSINVNDPELKEFYGDISGQNVKFTRIDINAPSKYFSEDLFMEKTAPFKAHYAAYISSMQNNVLFLFCFVAVLSSLCGAILGYILYKNPVKFALVGLANCFTIIGLAITMLFVKTKKLDNDLKTRIKQEGLIIIGGGENKLIFIISFIILYILMTVIISGILRLPLY